MKLRKPSAILIDLDDTLIATSEADVLTGKMLCERYAPRLRVSASDLIEATIQGKSLFRRDSGRRERGRLDLHWARREMVSLALGSLGINQPEVAIEMADAYPEARLVHLLPFPGAIDSLRYFKEAGIRLALVTNGEAESQRQKIERFDLSSFFDCILIEGEVGVGKPDERVFRRALDRLQSTSAEAWMIGDNLDLDVSAAQQLGLLGIWVDSSDSGLPEDSEVIPDCIVQSISELTR